MPLQVDPKVDYVFKRVFGDQRNEDILYYWAKLFREQIRAEVWDLLWNNSGSVPRSSSRN